MGLRSYGLEREAGRLERARMVMSGAEATGRDQHGDTLLAVTGGQH